MADTICEHAPAKVNLALHVTGRRADGYHLLDTLVVFAEAGDRIRVRRAARDGLAVTGPFAAQAPAGAENLVARARELARTIAGGRAFPVEIELEKNLPVASGIGGGSSDAAATLRALDRLWGLALPRPALAEAALPLGADLPMCLAAETLVARGIGETLTPAAGLPPLTLVLVNPGVAVATPAVFKALERRDNAPLPEPPALPGFDALAGWLAMQRNDLEAPAVAIAPAIAAALAALRGSGAVVARMSGSGATCFGLFRSRQDAARAASAIAAARPSWYVAATTTIAERAAADAGD
ncbi:MAG: 4-(cytidine 5'-diphospho)-2-C-methyl-D-erythritol kinase [Hyphomicrobiales bacterium]|nr:MAG: 4-(cytidine 5'-diphospho)-2-C-methyl-D-erythritol kinase [Hyphomicrobiales bacterium]